VNNVLKVKERGKYEDLPFKTQAGPATPRIALIDEYCALSWTIRTSIENKLSMLGEEGCARLTLWRSTGYHCESMGLGGRRHLVSDLKLSRFLN